VKGAWRNFRIQGRIHRAYPNPTGPSGGPKESETLFPRFLHRVMDNQLTQRWLQQENHGVFNDDNIGVLVGDPNWPFSVILMWHP